MTSNLRHIQLLVPAFDDGSSVKQALRKRHTSREFSDRPLSLKNVSELMWAAYGINRPDGHRTAPTAIGAYPLRFYVFTAEGVYLYRPDKNLLEQLLAGDHRGAAGMQDFVAAAPLSMVVYSDYGEFARAVPDLAPMVSGVEERMSALDAGASAENVYLYCSEAGLNVVERGMVDDAAVRSLLGLPADYHLMVGMTVGYPK